jgi:hypothetical protein
LITVGDLRRAIEGRPDDAPVYPGIVGDEIFGVPCEEIDVDFLEVSGMGDGVVLKFEVAAFDDDDWEYFPWDETDDHEDLD